MMKKIMLSLLLYVLSQPGIAADKRYTVITVDPAKQDLQLFLNDEEGRPFHDFDRLASWLKARNKTLRFAVNAGMYHQDFTPVGLFVADGKEVTPLNLSKGWGNFFLRPNGVFLVSSAGPKIAESSEYPALARGVRLATQSGPLMLNHGVIHRAFDPGSPSRHIRNGVGIVDGKAVFVISEERVNLHEFAVFFRDKLKCRDALYLDGSVSSLYSHELERNDYKTDLGPILGVVE